MITNSSEEWQMFHFSQANPKGPKQGEVPALLRRVAETVERQDTPVIVHDLVMHSEIDSDGELWPSITVYYEKETTGKG